MGTLKDKNSFYDLKGDKNKMIKTETPHIHNGNTIIFPKDINILKS